MNKSIMSSASSRVTGPVPGNEVQLLASTYSGSNGSVGSNIPLAWRHSTGQGVTVALVDDGFDSAATAQDGNFSSTLSRFYFTDPSSSTGASTFNGSIGEPASGFHGTTTSGLIGATGNLGGPIGVAPDATIVGVKVTFGSGSFQPFVDALTYAGSIAGIINNSWSLTGYGQGEPSVSYLAPWYSAVQNAVASGRSGLGSVIVFAAGNDAANANSLALQPINADPRVIAVAGSQTDGSVASYSTNGPGLLVSTIANNVWVPGPGTNQSVYESGTSYAAPTVSGIAALMLSVNPGLGWRDVQEILVDSAYTRNPTNFVTNGARDWNGGGRNFSNQLGFGVVDASVAVDLASVWTSQSTSTNLVTTTVDQSTPLSLNAGQTVSSQTGFASALRVQHVQVTIDDHNFYSSPNGTSTTLLAAYSTLVLISPSGTRSLLLSQAGLKNGVDQTNGQNLSGDTITSNAFWGENAAGTWTLVATNSAGQSAMLADWSLSVWGDNAATGPAPLVFTPSFAALATDPTRTTVTPAAGVTTIDLIDLPGTTKLNLRGGSGLINGVAVNLAAGLHTLFAAGSTGNLTVTDAVGGSTLSGGSGTNIFYVSNAADIIIQPKGSGVTTVFASVSYTLTAGAYVRYLRPGNATANLTLTGNGLNNVILGTGTGSDTLIGGAGTTVFQSGAGTDTMTGGTGNDIFYVNNSADSISEMSGGAATVYASVNYTLAAGVNVKYLRPGNATANLTLTGNGLNNVIFGSGAGNDKLIGGAGSTVFVSGAGIDTMTGYGSNDTFYVNNSADIVSEPMGGRATVVTSVNFALPSNAAFVVLLANAGSSGLTLTGNGLNDSVVGSAGGDTLVSAIGADRLTGGAGGTNFVYSALADSTVSASGRDSIANFSSAQGDKIDLHLINAVDGTATTQLFDFIGTSAFDGKAGELRYQVVGANTMVYADTAGSKAADFAIQLNGIHPMAATDFVL